MQIAPALRHAFRFVRLSAVVFMIAFAAPSLTGEEIDPRDYIGEDISKYPPHLKQQIERAFLRETGERFTGSQYDPRSPSYKFKRKLNKSHDLVIDQYYIPNNKDVNLSIDKFMEAQILSRPEASRGYNFEESEDKYHTLPAQIKKQRMEDAELRKEDLKYKEKILEQKTVELELKKIEQELEKFNNQSNAENEIYNQLNYAKEEIEALDVGDPEFLIKVSEIQKKYPTAFKFDSFIKNVLNPILQKRLSAQ